MITTITLNPAIDRTILTNECVLGQVNRIETSREDIGGKGINVTKVINALGGNTEAICFMGNQNREVFESYFQRNNLKGHFVYVENKTRTNTKVVDLVNMETTEFNEAGFLVNEEHLLIIKDKIIEAAKESNYMVFSGSVPRGCPKDIYFQLISQVQQYTKVLLDGDGELLKEGVKASPFLIKPNIHELENTFNVQVSSIEEVINGTREIIKEHGIEWALVSMGKDGSVMISNNEVYTIDPIPVEVKSTVGAGDSMLGGFVYALDQSKSMEETLRIATACGTLAVTMEGTQIFSKTQVEKMVSKVKINKVKA